MIAGCASSDPERSDHGRPYSEPARTASPAKDAKNLGMPWEKEFGLSAAIKAGDTIYVSGHMSYDDTGKLVGLGDLETQMRQAYANIKKVLGYYGAGMDRVVEEVIFVTDMKAALAVAASVRAEAYSGAPLVASTIIQVANLPVSGALVEIKASAKTPSPSLGSSSQKSDSPAPRRGGGRRGGGGMGFPF
jgi:enamine deaminase RidA (YjgF/YER057c/UK114 family)